jgi:multiple sugar transport system permease protein
MTSLSVRSTKEASASESWLERLKPTPQEVTAYLLLLPLLVLFIIFLIYPTITAFVRAFQQYSLGGIEQDRWIGFGNYARMIQEWRFRNSLRVTLIYAAGLVIIPYMLSLPMALFMNMKIRARAVFRTIFFLPVVTPVSAAGLVFVFLFNTDFGIINSALLRIGLIQTPVSWLGRAETAIPATLTMIVWSNAGFNAVTLLAGLQTITEDVLEAAAIDGALGWSLFRHITLPLLKPATITVITWGLVTAFSLFGPIYVMTQGGPGMATEVLGMYIYSNAFHYWQLGYATALSTVVFVICLIINAIMARVGRVDWR